MSSLVVAGVVTAVALALDGVLFYLVRRAVAPQRRAAAEELPGVELDPYHVLAVRSGWPDPKEYVQPGVKETALAAVDHAALCVLLIDELITVDAAGTMEVTARGGDPGRLHPVEAAWLECLHRAERPATMAELRDDLELRGVIAIHLLDQSAPLSRWVLYEEWEVGCFAYLIGLVLSVFYPALLVFSLRDGVLVNLLLTALLWLPVSFALLVLTVAFFPDRPNLLREHCATLPPHPAAALTDDQQQHLRAGA